jgi:hypothetical protein
MDHTTNPTEGIPLEVVQHTLWHFGDRALGRQPGNFEARLLLLFAAADLENRAKLSTLYPAQFRAFEMAALHSGGFETLRDRAKAALR